MDNENLIGERAFVKLLAGCWSVGIYEVAISPDLFWSQKSLYFVLMCLVL